LIKLVHSFQEWVHLDQSVTDKVVEVDKIYLDIARGMAMFSATKKSGMEQESINHYQKIYSTENAKKLEDLQEELKKIIKKQELN
jgi:hypothetical protein